MFWETSTSQTCYTRVYLSLVFSILIPRKIIFMRKTNTEKKRHWLVLQKRETLWKQRWKRMFFYMKPLVKMYTHYYSSIYCWKHLSKSQTILILSILLKSVFSLILYSQKVGEGVQRQDLVKLFFNFVWSEKQHLVRILLRRNYDKNWWCSEFWLGS